MASKARPPEPRRVRPDDVDPHHRWDRPLQAPGRTQVDFEERVDFRRLHHYRLARVRAALSGSGLGALLSFDQHNIRYTTSTVIGEWARDKLTRYSLLTGNGEPYIWDFGSAARHHKLYAPWLRDDLRFLHARLQRLGDVLVDAVDHRRRHVEQGELVDVLHLARLQHRLLPVAHLDSFLLQGEEHGRLHHVHAKRHVRYALGP